MKEKTIEVERHRRSTPSPEPRKNPDAPKPGTKTVQVIHHKRTSPKK